MYPSPSLLLLTLLSLTPLTTSTPIPALSSVKTAFDFPSSEFDAISTVLATTSCFSGSHSLNWGDHLSQAKKLAEEACASGYLSIRPAEGGSSKSKSKGASKGLLKYESGQERRKCYQLSDDNKKVEFTVRLISDKGLSNEGSKRLGYMDCRYNLWKAVVACENGGKRREGGFEYV